MGFSELQLYYILFSQVHSLSSGGLPRIIGGKDLVVHESKPTAERDDWFKSDPEVYCFNISD